MGLMGLLGAGTIMPFLGGKDDEEEDEGNWWEPSEGISALRNQAKNYYTSATPDYKGSPFMPQKQYVMPNFYAAHGGRAGYERGRVVRPGGYGGDETDYEFLKPDNVVSNTESFKPESKLALWFNALKEQVNPEHWGKLLEFLSGKTGELDTLRYNGGVGPSLADEGRLFGSEAITGNLDKAQGGIVGLANGGEAGQAQAEQMLRMEYQKYRNQGGTMSYQQFKMAVLQQAQQYHGQPQMAQGQPQMAQPQMAAYGGRMGYQGGEIVEDASMVEDTPSGLMAENVEEVQGEPSREQLEALAMEIFQLRLEELDEEQLMVVYQAAMQQQPEAVSEDVQFAAAPQEGIMQAACGGRIKKQEGGIMDLGGMEKDYRQEGGFVPLGGEEKADDVPARLSKNEFVFTADAVRAAGGGDIDAGAEVMENVMQNLEEGGQISEESQGGGEEETISEEELIEAPNGAQEMYDNMKQLETRIA